MKRFTTDNGSHEDVTLVDNVTGIEYTDNFYNIVDLMNEMAKELAIYKGKYIELKEEHFTQMGGFSIEKDHRGNYAIFSRNVIPKHSPIVKIKSPDTIWNSILKDIIWDIIGEEDTR